MSRPSFALAAGSTVVVLIAVAALVSSGQPQDARVTVSPTPSSTSTPPTTTPATSSSPVPVLDDRFGFLFSVPGDASSRRDAVRRENDPQLTYDLADGLSGPRRTVMSNSGRVSYGLAVSPDGRRIAYWTAIAADQPPGLSALVPRELHVLDLTPGARPRTLVTLTEGFGDVEDRDCRFRPCAVVGESVVWSSDGTGLVIGVGIPWFSRGCAADAPSCTPKYSALYLLEAAGREPRGIASIRGNSIVPVAWDRQAHLLAAFEFEGDEGSGRVLAYDVIDETGALTRTPMVIGVGGTVTVEASYDAMQVLAHEYSSPGQVVHVWPLFSPERAVVRSPRGEHVLAPARWRLGTSEIGVLFKDRLELWDAAGARRSVPLTALPTLQDPPGTPPYRPFFFRMDGRVAFIGRYPLGQTSSYVAVELSSGRSAVVPGEDWLSASVRFGP